MTSAAPSDLAWLDRGARAVARHWLLVFNTFAVGYAAIAWLAPLLQQHGWNRLGDAIFALYGALCHQLPERSFFVGSYQVCYCHRCTALYTSIAAMGLVYGAIRWRAPLPTRILGLAIVPILVDGVWHMANDVLPGLALRSDVSAVGSVNFWLRMATGALFGAAAVLWAYPRFNGELVNV